MESLEEALSTPDVEYYPQPKPAKRKKQPRKSPYPAPDPGTPIGSPDYYLRGKAAWTGGNGFMRERLADRDGGMFCQACLATENLTIDHVKPARVGGTDHISNLVIFCGKCNRRKKNYTLAEWIARGGVPERLLELFDGETCTWGPQ